jgi:hypothetical protein
VNAAQVAWILVDMVVGCVSLTSSSQIKRTMLTGQRLAPPSRPSGLSFLISIYIVHIRSRACLDLDLSARSSFASSRQTLKLSSKSSLFDATVLALSNFV